MRTAVAGIMVACVSVILAVSFRTVSGQAPEPGKSDAAKAKHAGELIAQARAAAGGEQALQSVTSLSATVQLRRLVRYVSVISPTVVREREKTLKGKVQIEFLLPEKVRRRVSSSTLLGNRYSYVEVVSGDRAWRNPPLQAASSNRDPRIIDVSDFERSLTYQAQNARQQLTFYFLAWLIQELPSYPLKFNSEGWTRFEGERADVINITGPDGYQAWFLLSQKTHLPLGFLGGFVAARAEPVLMEGVSFSASYMREMRARARKEREARSKPPQQYQVLFSFFDHRRVAGILLPHRLTIKIDERVVEELVVSKFEINRCLNARNFEPKAEENPRAR